MATRNVLIIDDEPNMRWILGKALEQAGYTVQVAESGDDGVAMLNQTPVDLVLLDLKLKGEDGLTVLRRLRERQPEVVVILLTAYGTVATAVEAMQLGAADFLRKPFDVEEITFKIARALERRAMQQKLAQFAAAQSSFPALDALVGVSPAWQRVIEQAHLAAQADEPLLLVGPEGSGRTTLARAIHSASARGTAPFVLFDVQLSQPGVRQAALFGEGARHGAWSEVGRGTLLICGLEDDEGLASTLGDALDARPAGIGPRVLVVATDDMVLPASLLMNLPLRLKLPPLRDRGGDILLLARHFAGAVEITPLAQQALEQYDWPEHVAEMRATVAAALARAGNGPIDLEHLPTILRNSVERVSHRPFQLPSDGIILDDIEQQLIRQALVKAHGNKSKAAELLGLTRHTLLYRMGKYGITGQENS